MSKTYKVSFENANSHTMTGVEGAIITDVGAEFYDELESLIAFYPISKISSIKLCEPETE